MRGSTFGAFACEMAEIEAHMKLSEGRADFELYSDLLFQKAELLASLPDARVETLLELVEYHTSQRFYVRLTTVAVVAEYLMRQGRIPRYFKHASAARHFEGA
jgi:hypothetical protein